jgi:WD40 repeat protein
MLRIPLHEPAHDVSVDQTAELAAVASRTGVLVFDLDNSRSAPYNLLADTKWDTQVIQFNPTPNYKHLLLSAHNLNVALFDIEHTKPLQQISRVHDRSVTDLAWNKHEHVIFATCSADSFINIWDTRTSKKKVKQFSAWTSNNTLAQH